MYYGECCPPQPRLFWTAGVEATFLNPDLNTDGVSVDVEEIDEEPPRYLHDSVRRYRFDLRLAADLAGRAGLCLGCEPPLLALAGFGRLLRSEHWWSGHLDRLRLRRARLRLHYLQPIGSLHDRPRAHPPVLPERLRDASRHGYPSRRNRPRRIAVGIGQCRPRFAHGHGPGESPVAGYRPEFGLYGRKPVFPCSCVHWFYNARWSALWGPTQTSVETFASVHANADPNISGRCSVGQRCLHERGRHAVHRRTSARLGVALLPAMRARQRLFPGGARISAMGWRQGLFAVAVVRREPKIVGQVDPVSILTANAAASVPQMDLIGIALSTGLTW